MIGIHRAARIASTWLAWMVYRRRASSASLVDAIPTGYGLAVVGLGVFAVGGIGDGIWHTVFGIETSIDALLSPTHLVMLTGILMSVTAPIRAYWRVTDVDIAGRLGSFLPVAISTALVATAAAFFFMYANGLANWPITRPYTPYTDDLLAAHGVLSTLVTTIILLGPVFVLLRRWVTPFGTFTLLFAIVGAAMAALDAFELWWQVIAPVVAGLVTDAIVARSATTADDSADDHAAGRADRRWTIRVIALVVPLVLWSVSTLVIHLAWSVRWPPELWIGQIVLAMMVAYGMALLTAPEPAPAP